MSSSADSASISAFIARWAASGAAERANFQGFVYELCAVLDVPAPEPTVPDDSLNAYVFERAVTFRNPDGTTNAGRIDLYRRGAFVMEGKQGRAEGGGRRDESEGTGATISGAIRKRRGTAIRGTGGWDNAMMAARGQAERYVRALPVEEGNPPFIVVVDVGHTFELYADFSRSGKTYVPFPDARNHRIRLEDLAEGDARELLRAVWLDPMSLDPSRRAAKVTREVADRLAVLARSLEASGHRPDEVAQFLMRCIFTMFAEDVKLIPERAFTRLLEELRDDVGAFPDTMRALWGEMARGGTSAVLRRRLLRFNGGLFEGVEALPLSADQLELLIDAGRADWHDVEPAIFGTLLERALDPVERHKLGAHYTPRAYVERLVMPTIVEPLREEWDATRAATVALMGSGDRDEAVRELRAFHHRLCTTTVLDPACGTGNFLYVTLEHLKRLEGEVLDLLAQLGESDQALELTELTVDPHQLLGIEINPRAAAIADLVLWIGYLQWHFRTHGDAMPREPVLHKYDNIENRDALLEYDAIEPELDAHGEPVTRWDGRTMKKHPVTGEDVPDETARVPVMRYVNPRKAEWPEAEFIVGNPPFIGGMRLREFLGDGYTDALRRVYPHMPGKADYVMFWWDRAAEIVGTRSSTQFGFITTNSLPQTVNREVVERHVNADGNVAIRWAVPDHPWVDASDGASVRISMTVVRLDGQGSGSLSTLVGEERHPGEPTPRLRFRSAKGAINSNLTLGVDVAKVEQLRSNEGLCSAGTKLYGAGFLLTVEEANGLGLGRDTALRDIIHEYVNGRDVNQRSRGLLVIDPFGLDAEELRVRYPAVYQHLLQHVKPERDLNRNPAIKSRWWQHGIPKVALRRALRGLDRFIVTAETSKHRVFVFLAGRVVADNKLICIASEEAKHLGVLSSRIHVVWAHATGSLLEDRPVYVKETGFFAFPFPRMQEPSERVVVNLAEQLDAHRKRQQSLHPTLTITDMYNVLEKLRSGEALTAKEKAIHEQGLVSVLKEIHDELDRAVLEAYGWEDLIPLLAWERREEFEEVILERLVTLNHERAEEEKRGIIRWLRPEYQAKDRQGAIEGLEGKKEMAHATTQRRHEEKSEKVAWPKTWREQTLAVRGMLTAVGEVMSVEEIARRFTGARADRIAELLETLEALGAVRRVEQGRYVG